MCILDRLLLVRSDATEQTTQVRNSLGAVLLVSLVIRVCFCLRHIIHTQCPLDSTFNYYRYVWYLMSVVKYAV